MKLLLTLEALLSECIGDYELTEVVERLDSRS
jgi:hypothetical protein